MELSGAAGRVTKEVRGLSEGHSTLQKEIQEVRSLQANLATTIEKLAQTTNKLETTIQASQTTSIGVRSIEFDHHYGVCSKGRELSTYSPLARLRRQATWEPRDRQGCLDHGRYGSKDAI